MVVDLRFYIFIISFCLCKLVYMFFDELCWRFSFDDILNVLHIRRKTVKQDVESRNLSVLECLGKDFFLEYKNVLECLLNGDVELTAAEKDCFTLELKEVIAELGEDS